MWSYRDVSVRERLLRNTQFLADASRLFVSLAVEPALATLAELVLTHFGDACAIDLATGGELQRQVTTCRDYAAPYPQARARRGRKIPPSTASARARTSRFPSPRAASSSARSRSPGATTTAYDEADLAVAIELGGASSCALAIARSHRQTQDALAARDEFLSVASHGISGPVAAIHLAVQALRQTPAGPAAADHLLAIVEREDRRIKRFVDNLIDVARIRAQHMNFVFGPVDLADVTREAIARISSDAGRMCPTFSIALPSELVGTWDRARLDQVVTHLLSNAVEFGEDKPIDVRLAQEGALARLVVEDRGIGIPAEAQARIFAPFERAVPARHYGGLGLGLYIVRTIVEGLGGRVALDSAVGRGTRVTVAARSRGRDEPARPWILVVDDDDDVRDVVMAILDARGYETVAARDGVEALERLRRRGGPALMLLDLRMPRMSGPEEPVAELRANAALEGIKSSSCRATWRRGSRRHRWARRRASPSRWSQPISCPRSSTCSKPPRARLRRPIEFFREPDRAQRRERPVSQICDTAIARTNLAARRPRSAARRGLAGRGAQRACEAEDACREQDGLDDDHRAGQRLGALGEVGDVLEQAAVEDPGGEGPRARERSALHRAPPGAPGAHQQQRAEHKRIEGDRPAERFHPMEIPVHRGTARAAARPPRTRPRAAD